MNKKTIRLTESDLHKIVRESTHKMLNEIGDSSDGQYMLGRTAERASQRAGRTYGVDRRRYDKTFKDAYSTAAKASKKHLGRPFGGTNDAFEKGRDDESDKWEETLTIESKNMNKNRIRLTESDLHRIVKESVNKILKEMDEPVSNRTIYVGNGGGYYGNSSILTVRMLDGKTTYQFSPSGWDFDTDSQLEAAAVCSSANKSFLKAMADSELNTVPITNPTQDDIVKALYWLTGGNAEWYHGYWVDEGIEWGDEVINRLLEDEDIMRILNNAISSSNNFLELVFNLKNSDDHSIFVCAGDALCDLATQYDDEEY